MAKTGKIRALVVAGGGSGGPSNESEGQGGGGGAGGMQEKNLDIASGDHLVIVGSGGVNSNGEDSSLGEMITSVGGGRGGGTSSNIDVYGSDGGSGGGGGSDSSDSYINGPGGSGIAGQGHEGGEGAEGNGIGEDAGGGGGAAGRGEQPWGGPGKSSDITGVSKTYAAGGDGGGEGSVGSGAPNTGDGGVGEDTERSISTGNGGSGVVIVRYKTADFGDCTGGTITTDGADTIHTFTESGTFKVILLPTLNRPTISNNQGTNVTATANIITTSNEALDRRGFVWSTTPQGDPGNTDPDSSSYADKVEEVGSFGIGEFSLTLTGLTSNIAYYIRAYAHNSAGFEYGPELQFVTNISINATSLITSAVTGIAETGAVGNGSITDIGISTPTERGFVWGDESRSIPASVPPALTGYDDFSQETGSFSTGDFTGQLSGLKRGTTYFIRSWARNPEGYSYGNEVSFTTLDLNDDSIDSVALTNEPVNEVNLTNKS